MHAARSNASTADVLVVGAGIAGLSAAYFAARKGHAVLVVDEGRNRASDLPIALVNPLRGHAGRLVVGGVEGMRATFALIDALRDAGHAIDAGRGLHRPLIDVPPAAQTRAFWDDRIGGRLDFAWHAVAPSSLGLVQPVPALQLDEAGWVAPPSLLAALRAASGATVLEGRVTTVACRGGGPGGVATLADGTVLEARSILWCGGAWGAALLDRQAVARADDALYRPGSLVAVDERLTAEALAFGLYATPFERGTLAGPTRESSSAVFPEAAADPDTLERLGDRIARVFGTTARARPVWRGVRLARLSSAATVALTGIPTLTSLGSRGFLMAPLLAARWARSL